MKQQSTRSAGRRGTATSSTRARSAAHAWRSSRPQWIVVSVWILAGAVVIAFTAGFVLAS